MLAWFFETFRSRVPILNTTTSQFPATITIVTFSKTGDVGVIEKTEQPFPNLKRDPRDVILKVCAATARTLQSMATYLFIVADVGRVCWCRLH